MPKIEIKDGNLEIALKKFKRISSETKRAMSRHEYHLRPGLRMCEKRKLARKRMQKKQHLY